MNLVRDDNLQQFATETQWKLYLAACEEGSVGKAARKLSTDEANMRKAIRAIRRKAAQQGYAPPDITHVIPEGLTLQGTSIRYNGEGQIEQYWSKTKPAGREAEDCIQLPDPKRIIKVASLRDQQGNIIQQWISEKPEEAQREALWRVFADELGKAIPRAEPVAGPEHVASDLLACYPVGDHHLGMMAWGQETGSDNYDLKIAEKLLSDATEYLVRSTPACDTGLIAILGDFVHYDSFEAVTPKNRNLLDADGRYPKMLRTAIRAIRHMVYTALSRHLKVHVIVEIGNHDPVTAIFIMELLSALYENEPRITIDRSPAHYHYFEFGRNLIGTHHGHEAKPNQLQGIMASDRAEAWGRTKYRYWWTGHVHHSNKLPQGSSADYAGCSVESFRVLAPVDAWAAHSGYRSIRDMKAIVVHKDYGECARHTVNPEMFSK